MSHTSACPTSSAYVYYVYITLSLVYISIHTQVLHIRIHPPPLDIDIIICRPFPFLQSLSRIKQTINISAFIDACKALQVPEEQVSQSYTLRFDQWTFSLADLLWLIPIGGGGDVAATYKLTKVLSVIGLPCCYAYGV